ncbi:hypothetical protein IV500_18175 [Paeniglutamicibacter antarcticus]|uniref:RelA/SpoT domain-containing protein n=1 Tax=Arthrobacter terrae TaxID=2935737 RepID=A0A931G5W3_9MICC|nr:hypothetical protein [Arthrobacter terrae]MBG0741296.1 hypothetical protein [Arthrobacter terrae]
MSVNVLSERHEAEKPHLEAALKAWKKNLENLARPIDRNVLVDGRVKELQSLLVKAYKDGPASPRSWDAFGDLVALKVVFPTLAGAETFTTKLKDLARCKGIACSLDSRRSAPEKLEYSSDQFDLCDPEICDAAGNGLKVEVQVRTVASDAWYMVDHRLRYKNATKLPENLRRRVLRLIVLTELFDAEVDSLIKDVNAYESDTPAGLFNRMKELFTDFTKSYTPSARPEGLFETLLSAYNEKDQLALVDKLRDLLAEDGAHLRQVMSEHKNGAENYVEKYDWLYMQPEVLLVADLARKPRLLASTVENTDFEQLVNNMADELKVN